MVPREASAGNPRCSVGGAVALVVLLATGSGGDRVAAARCAGGCDVNPACSAGGADARDAANFDAAAGDEARRRRRRATPPRSALAPGSARGPKVPGGAARWQPAGTGPLVANNTQVPGHRQRGLRQPRGPRRIVRLRQRRGRLYAAASQGGVWESRDLGVSWRSIGDGLPTQIVGAIGYSRRTRGTVDRR